MAAPEPLLTLVAAEAEAVALGHKVDCECRYTSCLTYCFYLYWAKVVVLQGLPTSV
jgi:hypothetical protein